MRILATSGMRRAAAGAAILALAGPAFPDDGAEAGASRAASGGGIDWDAARRFWSLEPPAASPPPEVRDGRWPRGPLDRFVLARLEEAGLAPSPGADARTLVRRLTFDLTGLPPVPEEVDAFAGDEGEDRHERLVDRLLASPRFGERMASLWLPLARYAEDQAHQVGDDTKFFYPNAHLYRQWVIDAFNEDMPYDRFVRLQLAADREEDARPGDLAALGFLGLGPKYYNRNRIDVLATEWEDRVDTVTRALLGLTVACARCHDHKYEPITTADYYALAGVFASTRMVNRRPDGKAEKGNTKAQKMDPGTLHVVEDAEVKDLHVFIRGNPEAEGPLAGRRFLRLLSEGEPVPFREGSGRKELAAAIARRENPLTARVLVNRVWGLLLGKPLVASPSNFGRSGAEPSHPALLDDLAARFMDGGWSVKALVREIALSATYRQASASDAAKAAVDPANRLLWRAERRRLMAEEWRDAALAVSGELEEGGGPSMEVSDPANRRRTVFARVSRLELDDFLLHFDYPDANVHAESRSETTTALQKLFVLNSPFLLGRARALAARLEAEEAAGGEARVRRAYRLLFGRDPEEAEVALALEFLARPDPSGMTRWEEYAHVLLASNEMMYLD